MTKIVFKEKCSEQFLIRNFPGTVALAVAIRRENFETLSKLSVGIFQNEMYVIFQVRNPDYKK